MDKNTALSRAAALSEKIGVIDEENERQFIRGMIDAIQEPPVKIPEAVFREIFLPYFIGSKIPDANSNPVAHWAGLVGGATEPADVIDVKGDVIYRVPPLYDTARIDAGKADKGLGFAAIFETYRDQASVHAALGINYLIEQLTNKADKNLPSGTGEDKGWETILRHYNLIEDAAGPKSEASTAVPGDDGLEFK